MKHPWLDRVGAIGYEVRRRLLWRIRRGLHISSARRGGEARLVYLMPGHGMTYPGAAQYADDGFEDVASWVYKRSNHVGFDVEAFGKGFCADFGDVHRQLCFVYRDNLVHFYWFLRRLASVGVDPMSYLIRNRRLLCAYHSSGLYAALYVSGCASWDDADRLATGVECERILRDVERELVDLDIGELRSLDPESADEVTREAIRTLIRNARKRYKHVPDGPETIERVFRQTTGEVTPQDSSVLQQVLRGKLICLSGLGPRPFVRGDVDRLLAYCQERGIRVDLSVINGPDLHVIGGSALHVARAAVIARKGYAGRVPFLVSNVVIEGAPHTGRFQEVVRRYESVVDRLFADGRLREPVVPFLSRYGKLIATAEEVREEVLHLLDQTYDFQVVCRTAVRQGIQWVVTGLSGDQSPGRRVVRANLMDAAMEEGMLDIRFASTAASAGGNYRERETLLELLARDAANTSSVGARHHLLESLENLKEAWEEGLEKERQSRSFRKFRKESYEPVPAGVA